jgi:NTE family protein
MTMMAANMRGWVPTLEVSPYQVPNWGEQVFRELLRRHFPFEEWNKAVRDGSPVLQVGAVEVLEGEFTVFDSHRQRITREMLLASAAVPNLFRAVEIDGRHYWDGLFSHNPPIVSMLCYEPDEVWVIQINPRRGKDVPTTVEAIEDRRNELSGNLSLEQELAAIRMVNAMLRRGELKGSRCCPVEIRRIELSCDLSYASKLERSPFFIERLMETGADEGAKFVRDLALPQ